MSLQELRKNKGLSQSQLAELSGVNVRMIQGYEQGSKNLRSATAVTVLKLAEALGVEPLDLVGPISFKMYVVANVVDEEYVEEFYKTYSKTNAIKFLAKANHKSLNLQIRVYEMSKVYNEDVINYKGPFNDRSDEYDEFMDEYLIGGVKCGFDVLKNN